MNKVTKMVLASVAVTVVLSPLVKSHALEHHTQWNFGVVLLLFVATLSIFALVDWSWRLVAYALEASDDE